MCHRAGCRLSVDGDGPPSLSSPPSPPASEASRANESGDDADSRVIRAFVDGTPEPIPDEPLVRTGC